jgi:hypothetical protein
MAKRRSRLLRILIEDFEERGFFGAIEAQVKQWVTTLNQCGFSTWLGKLKFWDGNHQSIRDFAIYLYIYLYIYIYVCYLYIMFGIPNDGGMNIPQMPSFDHGTYLVKSRSCSALRFNGLTKKYGLV